ncbi:hypothetical protein M3Y96_01230700 [Aphelenchoides besseyi]|nr:hypothetical protein M3Y96_01230700 [Aphelenchoides besseyi]
MQTAATKDMRPNLIHFYGLALRSNSQSNGTVEMQIAKKTASLKAELSHFLKTELTTFIVAEEDIHRVYNRDLDEDEKPLADKLQRLGTNLATFIANEFPDQYHYIPDKVKPTFVRVDLIRSDGPPAIAAVPSPHNTPAIETTTNKTYQKSLSSEVSSLSSSQPKSSLEQQQSADLSRRSTKSPPQHGSQFGPVGSGRATDVERHSGFTPPPGFSKIHAPVTGERSDTRSQYTHSFANNYTVDYPPSNSSSRTPSIPPPVEPFADFSALSSHFERLTTKDQAVYYDANDENAERALNNRQAKFAQQMEDYGLMNVFHPIALRENYGDLSELVSDEECCDPYSNGNDDQNRTNGSASLDKKKDHWTDQDNENAVEQSGTFAAIMEAQDRAMHDEQESLEQPAYDVVDANTSTEIIDLTPLAPMTNEAPHSVDSGTVIDLNEPQAFRRTPPTNINRPQAIHAHVETAVPSPELKSINKTRVAANTQSQTSSDNILTDTVSTGQNSALRQRISSTVTEPMDEHVAADERNRHDNRITTTRRTQPDYSIANQTQDISLNKQKLFYHVSQGSITNCGETIYQKNFRNIKPELYDPIPEFLQELAAENESLGPLIHTLQEIDYLYPQGMTADELATVDHILSEDKDDFYFGRRTSVMSIIECVDLGLIVYRDGSFFVREEIRDICLWHLPRGLTSNLYRLLACESISLIQDVARHSGILLDYNGQPIMLADEDIVRQANCWSMIFEIRAQSTEQHSMRTAQIMLDKRVPKWKVCLDSRTPTHFPTFCDCNYCTNGHPTCCENNKMQRLPLTVNCVLRSSTLNVAVRSSAPFAPAIRCLTNPPTSAQVEQPKPNLYYARYFKFERQVFVATLPLLPLSYFVHGTAMDWLLTAAIVANAHLSTLTYTGTWNTTTAFSSTRLTTTFVPTSTRKFAEGRLINCELKGDADTIEFDFCKVISFNRKNKRTAKILLYVGSGWVIVWTLLTTLINLCNGIFGHYRMLDLLQEFGFIVLFVFLGFFVMKPTPTVAIALRCFCDIYDKRYWAYTITAAVLTVGMLIMNQTAVISSAANGTLPPANIPLSPVKLPPPLPVQKSVVSVQAPVVPIVQAPTQPAVQSEEPPAGPEPTSAQDLYNWATDKNPESGNAAEDVLFKKSQ